MTTVHDIDLQQVLTERLTAAPPDVLRELLSMFIQTLMDAEADDEAASRSLNRHPPRPHLSSTTRHLAADFRQPPAHSHSRRAEKPHMGNNLGE
jgi:putative transposase